MSSKKEKSSIADLKAEIARMEDAIKAKTKALREEERRLETRKKILLGFVLQKWLEDGKISKEELRAGLDKYLTRKDERELFDINPPTEDKPSPQSSPETTNTKPSSPSKSPKQDQKVETASSEATTQNAKPLKEVNQKNIEGEFEDLSR